MKALCLVAHPDDCAIFGYHFITTNKFDWHITYLTYNADHERSREMDAFWQKRGVTTSNLNFFDVWEYVSKGELGFNADFASKIVNDHIKGYDLLLTHNSKGEYGHPHHIFLHQAVQDNSIPKVYFGNYPDICNSLTQLQEPAFDYKELPIHAEVVKDCNLTNWKYFITPEAEILLK